MIRNTINFVHKLLFDIFSPVHLLQASFECMLCTSYGIVMVVELILLFGVVFEFDCCPPSPAGGLGG